MTMSKMLPTGHHKRHDGHEEKAEGYYRQNDDIVKITFWIVVVSVVVLLAVQRVVLWRMRKQSVQVARVSAKNTARAISIIRWIGYPRLTLASRHITFPSQGEAIVLLLYWTMLTILLWTNVIFESPSEMFGIRWEVVGFRAAWVSTVQLPLLYCTGCRINPISIITNISHERMNWFHRWVARTLFMTLIVHWAFFYREWDIAHFVQQEFEMMPMVIWGFAAWSAIGVMVVTGFALFRAWCYELWLATHIIMAYAVLLLSYTHTHCTTYFVEASLGFLAFDVLGRVWLYGTKNLHFLRRGTGWLPDIGHRAELEILNHEYLQVSIASPGFSWLPGQHVYLNMPHVRVLESHPFTISSVAGSASNSASGPGSGSKMTFVIKAHTGFTKALYRSALGAEVSSVRTLVQGPYGNPPPLNHYDTVVLVASGNRASFTIPLMQNLTSNPGRVTQISFHLIIPDEQMLCWYAPQLSQSIQLAVEHNIKLEIIVHVTKRTFNLNKMQLSDVEMWPDDNYSIGGDSSEDSRSSTSTYVPVPTDQDDESSRLMTNSGSSREGDMEHDSSSMPGFAAIGTDLSLPSSTLHQDRLDDPIAVRDSQEERAALLSNTAFEEVEKNRVDANTDTDEPATARSCNRQSSGEIDQAMVLEQLLRNPITKNPPMSEKMLSYVKILEGRPQAPTMIIPAVQRTLDRGQVMVVAATASGLLSDITKFVAGISYKVGLSQQQTSGGGKLGGIELWSERNGD